MPGVDELIGLGEIRNGVEGVSDFEFADDLAVAEDEVFAVVVGLQLLSAVEVAVHFHGVEHHAVLLFDGLGADVRVGILGGVDVGAELLGSVAVPGETLQHDSVRRGGGFVDHVVKGVPACILPVAVDVQVHPQRVGVGRNVGRALHMEVQILAVPCKLGTDDVVAPGIVAVMRPDVPVRVPVARIADGGGIVRLHRAPLRLVSRQVDGRLLRGHRKRAHALVAADEIDKLIVVGIPQRAA